MIGWLVNDCLTTIPGTRTLWHDLLDAVPGLEDMTGGYTPFEELAGRVEQRLKDSSVKPDYIIRNATFFGPINTDVPTISFLQDIMEGRQFDQQVDVCRGSRAVVFNSDYTRSFYAQVENMHNLVIPIGIDFDRFRPLPDADTVRQELGVRENSILFVGDSSIYPKGFDIITALSAYDRQFCWVMKDETKAPHAGNVRVFNRVSHDLLVKIYNSCKLLVCSSIRETQHLAGIEAAACGLPIVAPNIGIYYQRESGVWGRKVENGRDPISYLKEIDYVLENRNGFSPRDYFKDGGFTRYHTAEAWASVVRTMGI
jgi:glycosyltransferase involved in cell wall biosynthesis